MASGTLYGPAAGSGGHWRAYAKWSDSQTETTFTCNWTTGMQSLGWGINVNYISADAYINGNGKHVSNQTFYSGSGATVMKDLVSNSVTIKKTKSTQRIGAACTVTNGSGYLNGSSRIDDGWTIPALKSYNVAYNANGGSGAPSTQTKWYGETLTLSSVKPTRTGYTFAGWNTNSSGTGTNYSAGGAYTGNAAVTLYAKWTAITYTVSYNANGGTGAPGNQTKTYGVTLKLSSTRPTRTNYNFKGWATSASATTPNYQPGGSFTTNATTTLYAVWQLAYVAPRITNLAANRCNSAGTYTEDGTYAKITFNWAADRTVSSVKIVCNGVTTTVSGQSGTSGSVSQVVGAGALSTENSYTVTVTVTDSGGSSTSTTTVAPLNYIMDFSPQGGIGIGRPAPNTPHLDVSVPLTPFGGTHFIGAIGDQDGVGNEWCKIGTYNSSNVQGHSAIIKVYGGAGQNAAGHTQNKYLQIFILDSYDQSGYFGVLVDLYGFNYGDVEVMVLATAYSQCDVWIKFDHGYERSYYSVEMGGTWTPGNATIGQTNTPTGGTSCTVYYNKVIKTDENMSIYAPGHFYLPNNGAIAGRLTSGSYSTMLRMNTANQVELTWTSGGLKGRVFKKIWSGTLTTGNITISELPYYNVLVLEGATGQYTRMLIGAINNARTYASFFNVSAANGGPEVYSVSANISGTSFNLTRNSSIFSIDWSITSNYIQVKNIYGLL